MKVLYVHNAYAAHTGEEQAANAIVQLLRENGHEVEWYFRSSSEIADTPGGSIKAFFIWIYNPCTVGAVTRKLAAFKPDVVQVQNVYPLISPSVFRALKASGVPVVMRCIVRAIAGQAWQQRIFGYADCDFSKQYVHIHRRQSFRCFTFSFLFSHSILIVLYIFSGNIRKTNKKALSKICFNKDWGIAPVGAAF